MKHLLLLVIKIYWFIIPKSKRRHCLFRISCSDYVYETTSRKGLIKGLAALKYRYTVCRPNYEIIRLEPENTILIRLSDNTIVQEYDIAQHIIEKWISRQHNFNSQNTYEIQRQTKHLDGKLYKDQIK